MKLIERERKRNQVSTEFRIVIPKSYYFTNILFIFIFLFLRVQGELKRPSHFEIK